MKQESLKLGKSVQHCHIILMPEPHDRAWQFLYNQKAKELPEGTVDRYAVARKQLEGWLGPQFEDVAAVQFAEGCVFVVLHDKTCYTYPLSEVARVKTFFTQENSDAA